MQPIKNTKSIKKYEKIIKIKKKTIWLVILISIRYRLVLIPAIFAVFSEDSLLKSPILLSKTLKPFTDEVSKPFEHQICAVFKAVVYDHNG